MQKESLGQAFPPDTLRSSHPGSYDQMVFAQLSELTDKNVCLTRHAHCFYSFFHLLYEIKIDMKTPSRSYRLLLAGTLLWCIMISIPALQAFAPSLLDRPAIAIMKSCSVICHQYDSRSFFVFGHKLAVCSRCFAIYTGFLTGILLWRFRSLQLHQRRWLWFIALAPMLIDVVLDILNVSQSDLLTRTVTGGWFGIIAALLMTPIFIEACATLPNVVENSQRLSYESDSK